MNYYQVPVQLATKENRLEGQGVESTSYDVPRAFVILRFCCSRLVRDGYPYM